jgi:hypothetical protein
VLQAITLVVQSTGSALVYLDCRMRYEGLDQSLISYVERRDLGVSEEQLGDPYTVDPTRAVTSAPPPKQVPEHVMMSTGYPYPQQYPGQQYQGQQYQGQQYQGQQYQGTPPYAAGAQPYAPQPSATPQSPAFAPAPPPVRSAAVPPTTPPVQPAAPTDSPWAPPASDGWAAPGASNGDGSA